MIKKLKFWVPVIAVVIVVVVLVWAVATSGNGSSSSDTQSGTESTSTSTSAQDTQSTSESEKTLDKTEGVAAQNGDTVNIDYTGYLDGTAFKGGSTNGSGADLELGSGTYIDGFEDDDERLLNYVAMSRARTLLEVFYRADLEEERQKMMLNSYNL